MNNASIPSTQKILVVEDNLVNRKVLVKQIQIMGYDVTGLVNGQAAVEYWQEHPVDLMLMDCQMPVMDGYEATQTLRELDTKKSLTIVGLTANTLPGDRQKCLDAGMDDYLPKPAFQQDLAMMFQKWLGYDAETTSKIKATSGNSSVSHKFGDRLNPNQHSSSTGLLTF